MEYSSVYAGFSRHCPKEQTATGQQDWVRFNLTLKTGIGRPGRCSKSLWDLVDLVGIEPTTSSMPWKRAPSCATGPRDYPIFMEQEQFVNEMAVPNRTRVRKLLHAQQLPP